MIAVFTILPDRSARSERISGAHGSPAAPGDIFNASRWESRDLATVSHWNRVLRRLPELSDALSACAADPARCTAPWMGTWLQARKAAAGLDRSGQLQAINRFFNRWPYKSDRETYGAAEYWAAPDEFMAYSGDCEDYAIAKFFALRELGFANQELRIAVVYDKLRRIGHAVLAVYTEGDILILNNQTDTIASHARYDNFVPWYLVNETTLWTAAGPTLRTLLSDIAVAEPAEGVSGAVPRLNSKGATARLSRLADRKGPAVW